MNLRVRFAPSPTGSLHLGNARTAIFNWLFARHHKGQFVLRIEDTDRERSKPEYEVQLIESLKWLGLDWDEGPDKGGPFGPYRQSERLEIYQEYVQRLLKEGKAYYCYCSQEELEAERRQCLAKGIPPRYSGKCRELTERQRQQYEKEGRRPAIRFRVPDEVVEFEDLIKGKMRFYAGDIGDFIIVRSNGLPAYNFAVVIDDAFMQITHVIRGEDHLANTACQLLLYEALNLTPPKFAHHPLLLAPDRTKLSKRHGAVSVEEYKKEGFLPQALLFYLTTLGSGAQKEIWDKDTLIERFDLKMTGKGNVIFDRNQLLWVNRQFLRSLPIETIANYAKDFVPEKTDNKTLKDFLGLIRENIATLSEISTFWPVFNQPEINLSEEAISTLKEEAAQMVIKLFYGALESGRSDYESILKEIQQKTGLKGRKLLFPLRLALTSQKSGPQLHQILEYLPREWIKLRLKQAFFA